MSRRGQVRRAVAALATLVALVGLTACGGSEAAPSTPAAPPGPLRILLVNDDGWNAPGIVALREALRRAGHTVVEIAPVADRSSSGTATTTTGELVVRRPTRDLNVFSVSGTAADAVLVALRAIMGSAPPDLVISGVNSTRALGLDAVQAGSVGAAMVASGLDFPSVAVSTEVANPARPRPEEFRRPVDFTVRLVRTLQEQKTADGRLVAQRTVLNVNYPGVSVRPGKVANAPSSNSPTVGVVYRFGRGYDRYLPTTIPEGTEGSAGVEDDFTAFKRGDVTMTDMSADPDRASPPTRTAARIAPLMQP